MLKRTTIALFVFLAIDAVWLSTMVPIFYEPQLGELLTKTPNWYAAAVFYVAYGIGVGVFSQWSPAGTWKSFGFGALLGLMAYGTYDLTNLSLIDNWPLVMTVVDILWGGLLTGTTMMITTIFTTNKTG